MLFENKYLHLETLSNLELIFGSKTFHLNVKKFSRSAERIQIFEEANERKKNDPIQTTPLPQQQPTSEKIREKNRIKKSSIFQQSSIRLHIYFLCTPISFR